VFLVTRREGIIAVTIFVTDAPMAVVDDKLGLLVPGDFPCRINCIGLGVVDAGHAVIAFTANGPVTIVLDYMLVLFHGENSFRVSM
jgi:hypothetical protein